MKKNVKIIYIFSGVLIYLYFIVAAIVVGVTQIPLLGKILLAGSSLIAILIWAISFGKSQGEIPIVFDPKKYAYNPEDKRKLSLTETMYYMRDLLLVKMFYGIALFLLVLVIITMNIFNDMLEIGVTDLAAMNVCMVVIIIITSVIFFSVLYITKRTDCTEFLLKNTNAYIGISKPNLLNYLEADLQKGIRFRSKRLILTNQYIIGGLSEIALSPVVIPIEQVKLIRYNVYYYGRISGIRYIKVSFCFELLNQKNVVLYVNYVHWQIVVQMFEHYGFTVLAEE